MTPDMIGRLPLAELDELVRGAWAAVGTGHLSEDTAQAITEAAEARRSAARVKGAVAQRKSSSAFPSRRKRTVSPDRQASLHRRRSLAASGMVPARIAASFTTSELAVLTVIAVEVMRRGRCELPVDKIAAFAGVSRRTCQQALRLAERQGLVSISERRRDGRPSLSNVIIVTSAEWSMWISRRGRVQNAAPHVVRSKKTGEKQEARHGIVPVDSGRQQRSSLDTGRPVWANRHLQLPQEPPRDERRR